MPTVKELREQAKSYGLRGYSTLRKPGLIRFIAEARAPVFQERIVRTRKTGRYPALTRGDVDNPHKKLNAFVSCISFRMRSLQLCGHKNMSKKSGTTPQTVEDITKGTEACYEAWLR